MSSQLLTVPCSIGYEHFKIPRYSSTDGPTTVSSTVLVFCITFGCFGLPTYDEKWHFGRSSPPNPALMNPEPCVGQDATRRREFHIEPRTPKHNQKRAHR